jgi:predicted site-specific integrase-resolvase
LETSHKDPKNPFEGWTSIPEAARQLGRDRTVIYYWVRKGYIRSFEVAPKVILINLEEVRDYANRHAPHGEAH